MLIPLQITDAEPALRPDGQPAGDAVRVEDLGAAVAAAAAASRHGHVLHATAAGHP